MSATAKRTVRKAVAERMTGSRPGNFRSCATAAIVGIAAAVITYRMLRSGG